MQLTLTVITVVSSTSVRTQYTIYIWHSLLCPTVYREHSLRCLNKGVLVSARYDWAWGSGSSVVDQLGCSSLSRCTSTRTTVGGAAGTGQASGDASVTRMLTSLFACGDGVRARGGRPRADDRRGVRRREPAVQSVLTNNGQLPKIFIPHETLIARSDVANGVCKGKRW